MELTDKVIVVTGAARGIGYALARRFVASQPRAVFIADVDGDRVWAAAKDIGAVAVRCDVSHESDIEGLVRKVESEHGRIDLFCSNAGIAVGGGPEAKDQDWQRIWEVNTMAHVYAARHVLPGMLARRQGYLLGTISAAGLLNHVFAAPYAMTKAAALSLYEWIAIAHGDDGIRVSCLCPQGVKTDMLALERRRGLDFLTDAALEPDAVAEAVVEGLRAEKFLILPHPEVADYFRRKANDYDRWLGGMRRMRSRINSASQQ
ncbi:MAG TPA: SDR family oxidoreductase [Candidatus Udaeobacter sp.]|nr:SDR family oxidoreductase [Candidatus Udaeobacter sp.]